MKPPVQDSVKLIDCDNTQDFGAHFGSQWAVAGHAA